MSLQIGIVGLPNVGKSTLFQALTRKQVAAENYPFCTIDPNVGVVAVPDRRLEQIAPLVHTTTIIPAAVEFVDIAGLVKGAHKGEGLGNQFLAHIRSVDAIVEVVRVFHDAEVVHVAGEVDPAADMETIHLELVMADLQMMEKMQGGVAKRAHGHDSVAMDELALMNRVLEALEKGNFAGSVAFTHDEEAVVRSWQLLTMKPQLIVANVDEGATSAALPEAVDKQNPLRISAKIEAELSQLAVDDAREMMEGLGMKETGLQQLIRRGFSLLNLCVFFTAGEKEVRAWPIPQGAHAPQAAGVIHSDFERGFIRAEVVGFEDFLRVGGWLQARSSGKVRMEGKDYVMQDGDVMIVHHA